MNTEKQVGSHHFNFSPQENGGESLILDTEYFDNGDGVKNGLFTRQNLTLNSYCNSSTFHLVGIQITPKILRELANELEQKEDQIKSA